MEDLDWNDLKYVVAVAREGSAAAAGRLLGVSHATVLRRVAAIELGVGAALFDRLPTGYVPSEVAKTLIDVGESFERALLDTRRRIEAKAAGLSGVIRFTTTDSLAHCIVPPILASFRARYPAMTVELVVTNAHLNLDRRDADVTLRPTVRPPESWVGMRLAHNDFGLFASHDYLALNTDKPRASLDWLMPEGNNALTRWMQEEIAPDRIVGTANSFLALRQLVANGLGAAALPIFMAGPDLKLLAPMPRSATGDLWVLTHADLRRAARIHAFMEHLASGVRAMRGMIESEQPAQS
jgi:DNA-binding transcriptional LysR family regulator